MEKKDIIYRDLRLEGDPDCIYDHTNRISWEWRSDNTVCFGFFPTSLSGDYEFFFKEKEFHGSFAKEAAMKIIGYASNYIRTMFGYESLRKSISKVKDACMVKSCCKGRLWRMSKDTEYPSLLAFWELPSSRELSFISKELNIDIDKTVVVFRDYEDNLPMLVREYINGSFWGDNDGQEVSWYLDDNLLNIIQKYRNADSSWASAKELGGWNTLAQRNAMIYQEDKNISSNMVNESEWNFHFGKEHNGEPYVSDNKFQMFGRETGHFGSGTYFSTYRDVKNIDDYGELSRNMNPNFIQIANNVYRVDFDLYKNLYRVRSKKQGDILYTMMKNLNSMYNNIVSMGEFKVKSADYNNARKYQIIKRNAEALNLRCPSYYELIRMAQKHKGVQSFSTLFMEWNGYNGVNVSGVDYYDNTKHGSVIYDLSKVNIDMEEVEPRSLYVGYKDYPYDGTIARNGIDDSLVDSLQGKSIMWCKKLNGLSVSEAMRLLKNYMESGHILDSFEIVDLNDDLKRRYLRLIYIKNPRDDWGDSLIDRDLLSGRFSNYFVQMIEEYNLYYWLNYESKKDYNSVLVNLLNEFEHNIPWSVGKDEEDAMKRQYLDKLMGYMERGLTLYEEEYIKEDYYDNDEL